MIIDIVRNQSRDSRAAYQLDEIDKGIFRIKAFIAAAIMKKYSRILTIKLPAAMSIYNAYSKTCTAANQCLTVGNIGHYVAIQANIHASQAGKVNAVVVATTAVQSDMVRAIHVDRLIGSLTAHQTVDAGELFEVSETERVVVSVSHVGNRAPLGSVRNTNLPIVISISPNNSVDDAVVCTTAINAACNGTICTEHKMVRVATTYQCAHARKVGGISVLDSTGVILIALHQLPGVNRGDQPLAILYMAG